MMIGELRAALDRLADPAWTPTAADFPDVAELREFQAVSDRPLSGEDKRAAYWWAWRQIYPARTDPELRAEGFSAVILTSFARTGANVGAGCHGNGYGLDLVPRGITIRRLHRWYAENKRDELGEILDETDDPDDVATGHLHLSRWPCGATRGRTDILSIDSSGRWHQAAAPIGAVAALAALATLAVLFLALMS